MHVHLNPQQKQRILEAAKKKEHVAAVAEELGVRRDVVSSYRRLMGLSKRRRYLNAFEREDLVETYFTQGFRAASEKYPGIMVYSSVSRYTSRRKERVWSEEEKIEMARMAGFISFDDQVAFLKRPKRAANSLLTHSFWQKRCGIGSHSIHGLIGALKQYLCRHNAPVIALPCQAPERRWRGVEARVVPPRKRRMVIWADAERHLRPDVPPWVREVARAGARFQRWLYQTDNPRGAILMMMAERTGLAARIHDASR